MRKERKIFLSIFFLSLSLLPNKVKKIYFIFFSLLFTPKQKNLYNPILLLLITFHPSKLTVRKGEEGQKTKSKRYQKKEKN